MFVPSLLMQRDTRIQLIAVFTLVTCLLGSIGLATTLTGLQGREKLAATDQAEMGQSKEVSIGIAMGAFRGIFVNFLWIRANAMKEAGKYFDAIELSRAITRLQPRFPRVWVFHAWNLSYNISVMTQTAEERWGWINAGIRLLRDQGIPANPNDMLLHKELGWIFLHKIGGYSDDANAYYKRRLASEWTILLGPPPMRTRADRDRDHRIGVMTRWLQDLADAPDSLEALYAANPAAKALAERIQALGYKLDFDLLGRYETHRAGNRSNFREEYLAALRQRRTSENELTPMERFIALVDDPTLESAWQPLLLTLRRSILTNEYKMDIYRMIRFTQKFGPIDWRHHAAHGLYWSAKGVEDGLSRLTHDNRRDFDTLNTDRITVQSVQDLFRTGELYFDFFSFMMGRYAAFIGVPDAHFVRTYGEIIEGGEVRARSWADQLDNRGFTPLSGGYENFLRDAICFFYRRADYREANYWYDKLRNFGGLNLNNPFRREEMSAPLDEFVRRELNDRATSPNVAQSQVNGALIAAYTSGLLSGDQELFQSNFEYAKQAHLYFMQEQRKSVVASRTYVRMDQLEPDFRVQAGMVLVDILRTMDLDDAERIYDRAPPDLKRFAFDELRATYQEDVDRRAGRGGRTFAQIFPEPEGMRTFRESMRRYLDARNAGGMDVELR